MLGNVKVHWHVVAVRSCWTTPTLSTSCCCLHGGHRLELEIIPMPGSSPTLLLAPTSRPVLTEQPSCSLPSAAAGHPPISRAATVAWRTEGWPVEEAAAGGFDDGFRPLWQLAGGACGASCGARSSSCCCCRSRDGKWASDVLPILALLPGDLGWATHRSHKSCEGICSTFDAAAACNLWSHCLVVPGDLVDVKDRMLMLSFFDGFANVGLINIQSTLSIVFFNEAPCE